MSQIVVSHFLYSLFDAEVDSVTYDLAVEDTNVGSADFMTDLKIDDVYDNGGNANNEPIALNVPDARQHK